MSSPTSRSLEYYRKLGFTCQVVERFNRFSNTRLDLFGFIDIVAMKPGVGIVGIQATSGSHHSDRVRKSTVEKGELLRQWLESGGRFEVISFAKRGERGKAKRWTARREEITIDQVVTP